MQVRLSHSGLLLEKIKVEIVKRKENEAKVHAGPPVAMGAHQHTDMGGSGGPS